MPFKRLQKPNINSEKSQLKVRNAQISQKNTIAATTVEYR